MILEFGAKNYFSIKEWVSISFRLNSNCPPEISQGESFTRILGVKGANGSGKTNILKALTFIGEFAADSWIQKPEDEIDVATFFSNEEPVEFYSEFQLGQTIYRYELSVTKQRVLREALYRTKQRETLIIERIDNVFKTCSREFLALKAVKLRDNASFISTAHQYEIEELNEMYCFFKYTTTNVNYFGLADGHPSFERISELFFRNEEYFNFAKDILIRSDLGIQNIEMHKRQTEDGKEKFFPIFIYNVDKEEKFLTFYTQSSGTKALYLQIARYKLALDFGGILVLDEFDNNLHPFILPMLLELFLNKEFNQKAAQLIFTTHNTEVIDFLGRYRTYLVNKEDHETYAYRLDEIPGDILRNDRLISPLYLGGKIGGVPNLEK